MFGSTDYRKEASAHEDVFRKVLTDLKEHRAERPMGHFVPEDLDTTASIDEIFERYSKGVRHGIFTILNFSVEGDTASISFKDVAPLSGEGGELKYKIDEDRNVQYNGTGWVMMS